MGWRRILAPRYLVRGGFKHCQDLQEVFFKPGDLSLLLDEYLVEGIDQSLLMGEFFLENLHAYGDVV